ncbi:MAG: YciI family protein [Anaerolineae bacterium]|nr:transcription initiation protein [Anaerolineales bacterium]MCQ3974289.1 transcription initiation protein [Anaerolineae bacterium]
MKEFLLLFRNDYEAMPQRDNPEEWQAAAKKWQDWIGGIAAQNRWVATGQRLSPGGKVVRTNGVITDGPYTEIKETLISYCAIKAETIEEAAELAIGCPILTVGGTVEVREISVW